MKLDEKTIARNSQLKDWVKTHLVKVGTTVISERTAIPSTWITSPPKYLRARETDEGHVRGIMDNMCKNGIYDDLAITVLMWVPENETIYTAQRCDFDLTSEKPPYPMYAIIGDHTSKAIILIHEMFPNNMTFKNINVRLLVMQRSPENEVEARYLGTLDNTIRSIHQAMTQWDCVSQIHDIYEFFKQKYGNGQLVGDAKKKFTAYVTSCEDVMPFTGGTFSTFRTVAKVSAPIWKLITQIFSGQFKQNREIPQKIPKSLTNFSSMGNVPEDLLIIWLNKVVEGKETCKGFQERCTTFKKEITLKEKIVEYLQSILEEDDYSDWSDVIRNFPEMGTKIWFGSMLKVAPVRTRENLGEHAKNMIDDMVAAQQKNDEEKKKEQVCYMYYHTFYITMNVFMKVIIILFIIF